MAVTDMDLEMRSRQLHRANLTIATVVTVIGALLIISVVLSPIGLVVLAVGLAWLGVALFLGRADRNRRETHRAPGEMHEG